MTTLVVIAKECVPGRVKTRLTPPLEPDQAADLATLSLEATLRTAARVRADRRLLFFDGRPPEHSGFEVLPQPDGELDQRIAALFDAVAERTLLIGMDTPQLDAAVLQSALDDPTADAWFGPATDGGFWALGLDRPRGDLVRGVRMSQEETGRCQLRRLEDAGLRVQHLPVMTDVDTIDSARDVAALMPSSPFAAALRAADTGTARRGSAWHELSGARS